MRSERGDVQTVDLEVDVTAAAGLGEPATIALTVHVPPATVGDDVGIVCFAKPGAGFSRGYFTHELRGRVDSQAAWHASRGWVFVSVDHLGVGGSSTHHDPTRLDYATVAAASHAAERFVLDGLEQGTLVPGFRRLFDPVTVGLGQSMGGCLTVVQQAHHHCYDGIAVLGFSAVHTHPRVPPGESEIVTAWRLRGSPPGEAPVVVNRAQFESAERTFASPGAAAAQRWLYYYYDDEVPSEDGSRGDRPRPWISLTMPTAVTSSCTTPGVIASEAAAVTVPVLVAMGERDVIADPKGEPRAYLSATSVDLYECPRMGHMHNFATTRELLWHRIETWVGWVTRVPHGAPAVPSGS